MQITTNLVSTAAAPFTAKDARAAGGFLSTSGDVMLVDDEGSVFYTNAPSILVRSLTGLDEWFGRARSNLLPIPAGTTVTLTF